MDFVWYLTPLLLLSPTVTDAMCITSCAGRSTNDGMRYPDCDHCDYYIRCEASGMERKRCPLTLTFNADARNCDYPANAKCGATSATTSATTTSPTTTSPTTTSPTTTSPTTTSPTTTSPTTTSATLTAEAAPGDLLQII
ncbi:salivary glue protein Sgs-3-like [Haliotis rufescens]|uniref:salivary glue protein Sgs-3-like n=1 Tax=Haliotis rufescens TaxID=6454 RepID=UPI00201E81A3|nr:salivary glue protein Sgs-3-like [Haliotis rufescens]